VSAAPLEAAFAEDPAGDDSASWPAPEPRVVTVKGVPMSALAAFPARPRLVIVALHGGAVTSSYWDYREHPRLSLLRAGAALGYTVIALDRPGFGASAGVPEPAFGSVPARVDLVFGAIEALLAGSPRGAGVFLMGHSMGCLLAVQAAASPRGQGLLGLEIGGTGQVPHPGAAFMAPLIRPDRPRPGSEGRPRRATLHSAMWTPAGLYPPDASAALAVTRGPRYEGDDIRGWTVALPGLAASVRIPVRYTLGDHERVWDPSPAAMESVTALFTASPRAVPALQAGAAHNLSRGWSAAAYHQRVFAFAEQCLPGGRAPGVPSVPATPNPPGG
jgi:pimeloyl-ACP methyl ester carboxylesterase